MHQLLVNNVMLHKMLHDSGGGSISIQGGASLEVNINKKKKKLYIYILKNIIKTTISVIQKLCKLYLDI